jgi:hypothetical protein
MQSPYASRILLLKKRENYAKVLPSMEGRLGGMGSVQAVPLPRITNAHPPTKIVRLKA